MYCIFQTKIASLIQNYLFNLKSYPCSYPCSLYISCILKRNVLLIYYLNVDVFTHTVILLVKGTELFNI